MGDRPILVGRELTKAHQEFVHGTAADLLSHFTDPRGEFTLVIGPAIIASSGNDLAPSDEQLAREFGELTNATGFGRRDAIAAVAKKFGRTTREVYAAVERVKAASE